MRRASWTILFIVLVCLQVEPLAAQVPKDATPPNPVRFFEESFGGAYRKVLATREFEDDLELAKQLLESARSIQGDANAQVAVYLCDRAFSLGMSDPSGFEVAIAAMEHRIKIVPAQAGATRQRVEQALRRTYSRERGETKIQVGRKLADYLTHLGDLQAASSDFGGAARLYIQAQRFAKDVGSPNLAAIETKAAEANAREELERRIDVVQERFLKGVNRAVAADELVQIYLLEFDQPSEAARYAGSGSDADAKRLVPLLLKAPDDVESADALALAPWCEALAIKSPQKHKLSWYQRSRTYAEQFMVDVKSNELDRLKTSVAIKRVRSEIFTLDPDYAKTVAPMNQDGDIDLIEGIELRRYKINGRWSHEDGTLLADATKEVSQLMLPVVPTDGYEFSANFTRTSEEGELFVQLPIGSRVVRLILGGWAGKAAGLYPMATDVASEVPGEPTKNKTTVTPHSLTSEQVYALNIRVERAKSNYRVTVTLDGKNLLEWSGLQNEFAEDPKWSLWEPVALGIGVQRASVAFTDVKLKPLRGDGIILPKPKTLVERRVVSPRDGSVDLSKLRNNSKDVVDGTWTMEDGVLTGSSRGSGVARTLFPIAPTSDYHFHVEFTVPQVTRNATPMIYLPWGENAVSFVTGYNIETRKTSTGLASVDGANVFEGPARKEHMGLTAGKKYSFDARMKKEGDELALEIDLDGMSYIRWKGDPALLSVPADIPLRDNTTIGLGVKRGSVLFENVIFKSLKGDARITRVLPKTAGPKTPLVTDTSPVSPLKHFDIKRDRASGPWRLAGNSLTVDVRTVDAPALVNLPVQPKGSYKVGLHFTPTSGRPMLMVLLPVAGTSVQLNVGQTHGKYSNVRVLGSDVALKSTTAIRVGPGRTYKLDVTVEHEGKKLSVNVDSNGKSILSWKGVVADLSSADVDELPDRFNIRALGIGILNNVARSSAVVSNIRLQMTRGVVTILK